jgi:hypothetical protein
MSYPFIGQRTSWQQRLADKTRDDRESHRAYAGHEPPERAHRQIRTPAAIES